MSLKKATVIFLVMCIVMSIMMPLNAASTKSSNEMAITLNKFNILKGDGKDFNLNGSLVRGEAATFIVRLMGMEESVLADKAKWANTKFKDVQSSAWYAPYVGYCSQMGIIDGYPDGNYKPNENISEKAFIKLVLGVLGYKYNVDYTWNNVYRKAYDVGLVYGPDYEFKEKDDVNYKRGSVVTVLFNSLDRTNRTTKVKVLDSLLEKGIIKRADAVSEGFIKDSIITAISSIGVLDATTVKVKFNEKIKSISSSSILISETQNTSTKLTATIKSQSDDEVTITTSTQIPDKGYTINISDVSDQEKNVNTVTGTFTGYKNVEVKSDFFRISKIEPVSKNVINVFFTHPVNLNAEVPMYFDVLDGTTTYIKGSFQSESVKCLAPYDNAVSIFFKEKDLADNKSYSLKVSGELYSVYGTKLNNGSGESMGFVARASANEGFYVTNITAINKKYIRVRFNKDVDVSSAQVFTNYSIKDSNEIPGFIGNAIVTKEGVYKNKEVTLQVGSWLENKQYKLIINNVYDSFRQIPLTSDQPYQLVGVTTDIENLSLVNVFVEDKGTLSVYFNRPLSDTTATDQFRYTVTGITNPGYTSNPIKVYYNSEINPYMVKLFIAGDEMAAPNTFKLKVDKIMQDYFGETPPDDLYYTFNGTSNNNIKPYMTEALIISNDTIKVSFNEEISANVPNTLSTNYSLSYKDGSNTVTKNPASVNYVNAKTLTLRFDNLDLSKVYTLKFNDRLVDYSDLYFRLATEDLNSVSVRLGN